MTHTAIPKDELKVFESLKNIKVVFDVGARDDVDYLIIKPNVKLHAFEPNPVFFMQLSNQLKERKGVYLNNYGLGDKTGKFAYSEGNQSFQDAQTGLTLPIKTLDSYVRKHKIKRIDFLKIDVEGWDFKVLLGGKKAIKLCRYIQFEQSGDLEPFQKLLKDFDFDYIGGRNYICTRKGEDKPWIPPITQEGGLIDKDESNRLKI